MNAPGLLDAALGYAARGWPVFPVYEMAAAGCSCGRADCITNAGKHPRTEHGFKDATTEPGKIREMWRRWPGANIGIVTGSPSGLLVLDVDPRNGGIESLKQIEDKLPRTTLTAETGSGGMHGYYRLDGAAGCRNGLLPGLDIKADGGYVVAPPSRTRGAYSWMNAAEPAPAPDFLVSRNGHAPAGVSSSTSSAEIPDGRRGATLTSLAGTMRRRGMTATEIEAALLAVNAARCNPPLPDDEVQRIARSVSRYEPGAPVPANQDHGVHDHGVRESAKRALAAPLDIRATLTAPEEPIAWIVEPYICRGEILLVAGESGIGKSLVLLDLALALTAGHEFLSMLPVTGGPYKVLYIDLENPARLIRRRLRRMIHALEMDTERAAALPLIYIRQPALDLGDAEDYEALLTAVETHRPDFVFIDSLVRVHRGDENSNSEMRDLFAKIQLIPSRFDCGVVVSHHLAKPSQSRPESESRYRIRGASDILGAVDAAVSLQRTAEGFTIIHEKTRWDAPGADLTVTIEDVDFGQGIRIVGKEKMGVMAGVVERMLWDGGPDGAGRADIVREVVKSGLTPTQADKATSRELARRHRAGLVQKKGSPAGMRYWLKSQAPEGAE